MFEDPIVEEIRSARHAHARKLNNDLSAIVEDIRRLERESGRQHVNFAPRPASPRRDETPGEATS
jgi:hypothetical protein